VRGFDDRTSASQHGSHINNLDQMKKPTQGRLLHLVQGVGFEPTKAEPTDLQSVVFDRFTNPAHLATHVADEHLPGLPPKDRFGILALHQNVDIVADYNVIIQWSHLSDSNRRPSVYKTDALTS
jgi:hypothetical protein